MSDYGAQFKAWRKKRRRKRILAGLKHVVKHGKNEKSVIMGVGHPLEEVKNVGFLSYPDGSRKGHFWCFGTTRSGKTRLMEAMVEQDIRLGNSVCVIDPKGDHDLFNKIVQVAIETGREEDLMLLSPVYPDQSIRIDPLSHYFMAEEVVSHITSGIKAREQFYIDIANEVSSVVVNALILFAKIRRMPAELNFQAVKDRIGHNDLRKLRDQLAAINNDEAQEIIISLDQILSSPPDYFAKVSSTLRTTLSALTTGNVGKIIGRVKSNEFIDRLEKGKKVIIVVQTGSLLTRQTAHVIGRVFLSMIQSFVGRRFAVDKPVTPPLCIYIDEAANVLYQGIEDLFSKAGGAQVWVHAFSQSLSDLTAEFQKDATAYKILDNTNTKVFMRINHTDTGTYVSDYAGTRQRFSPILALGGGASVREMEEPIIKPEDPLRLIPREFFYFTYDGNFRGKTVTVPTAKVRVKFPPLDIVGINTLPDDRLTTISEDTPVGPEDLPSTDGAEAADV